MTERVGLVGLGNMGAPMAARLAAAGVPLTLFDARGEAAAALARELSVALAPDVRSLGAASDILITMLPDGAAVAAVASGLEDTLEPGSLLLDMSSSAPAGTVALAARLAERGVGLVDAPVSGGVERAREGTLSIMAGGARADLDRVRPLLDALGATITETGPAGSGHALKALNNALSAVGLMAAAEVVTAATRFGIEPTTALAVLNASTGRNHATEVKYEPFVLSGSFDSGFALGLQVKDVDIAVALLAGSGLDDTLVAQCLARLHLALAALGDPADHTEVVRWVAGDAETARRGVTESGDEG